MRVFIITKEPFPNGMAATNRIQCYAKAIISQGIECNVMVYTRTEIAGSEKNKEPHGVYEGVPYSYIGGEHKRTGRKTVDMLNSLRDRLALYNFFRKNLREQDVVIAFSYTNVRFTIALCSLVHRKKAKFVRELCELPFAVIEETRSTTQQRQITLNKLFPECDGFIAISDALVEVANRYKSRSAKVVKIPILVDYDKYSMEDRSQEADVPYIFHSGTLSEQKDGFVSMVEAFGMACKEVDKPIMFISTGKIEKSPHKKELMQLIDKYGLKDKLVFTGYLPEDSLREHLSKASLVIINKYENTQNRYCFSTKLGEYMAAGKSVILTEVGEAVNWVQNGINAWTIKPDDKKELAEKIVYAMNNEEARHGIGEKGRELCRLSFDYRAQAQVLANFLNELNQ